MYAVLLVDVKSKSIRLDVTAEASTRRQTVQDELTEFKTMYQNVVKENLDLPHMVVYNRAQEPLIAFWWVATTTSS